MPASPTPDDTSPYDDWRLAGQEKYLMNATLNWRPWRQTRPHWDHDHCAFCWAKFGALDSDENLHEGYTDKDEYHWVCQTCARDFADRFHLTLFGGPNPTAP